MSESLLPKEGRDSQLESQVEYRADDRYADDIHINRELREVERWNDPAAEFLTVSPCSLPSCPRRKTMLERVDGC